MWAWLSSVQSGQSFIFSFVGERKFALKETDVERGREREREKVGERERDREGKRECSYKCEKNNCYIAPKWKLR